ncbi:MAG: alpha-hydroxy acid oxidase, partial [Planctomycetota bacterium]
PGRPPPRGVAAALFRSLLAMDERFDPRNVAGSAARDVFEWLRASPVGDAARQMADGLSQREVPAGAAEARNVDDLRRAAMRALNADVRDYLEGGAEDQRTLTRNRTGFERRALRPRRLVDVSRVDSSLELFGERLPSPLLVAPIGFQGVFHDEAECATARGVSRTGHRMVASTVSTRSVEEIAAAAGGALWFQLYPTDDRKLTTLLLRRAEAAGCQVCFLTVDTPVFGNREHGGAQLTSLMHGGVLGNFDGGFDPALVRPTSTTDASLDWGIVAWLREQTSMRIVLKGIVTAEDAGLAVERGVDGLSVSNHGGRQEDAGRGAIDCLPEVVDAVRGRVPVLFDSGVRRGVDALMALALGADAVLVGRPWVYGLSAFGAPGVARTFEILQAELETAMRLVGAPTLAHLTRAHVAED